MSQQLNPGVIPEWTLADRLRKAREAAGYGSRDFAAVTSISRGTISAAENGHSVPTRANMRLWALATGVPFEWLETGEAPRPGGDGGPVVHPLGLEPRTHWIRSGRRHLEAVAA